MPQIGWRFRRRCRQDDESRAHYYLFATPPRTLPRRLMAKAISRFRMPESDDFPSAL